MVITFKNAMVFLLLIAAVSLTTWSLLDSKKSQSKYTLTNSNIPDALMEDVVATIMNKEGTPTLKVSTPRMVHYANNDATDIEKPVVTVYRHTPNPWLITSDYARATSGTTQILFWRNVVLNHAADNENPATIMHTEALTVFPNQRTAQTDQPITINQPDLTVHATGMLADMNEGTVKLLSKAQGEYVPVS
jgi:lipopolysaccharide export system protein LptC